MKINLKFLFLTVASFIFAYVSGGDLPYTLFYILFIALFSSIIYSFVVYKGTDVKVHSDVEECNVGDEVSFTIVAQNNSIFPWFFVHIYNFFLSSELLKYEGNYVTVPPVDNKRMTKEIQLHKRGIYDIGESLITIIDPFKIISIKKKVRHEKIIKVYPRVYNLAEVVTEGAEDSEKMTRGIKGLDEKITTKDIRKYVRGDSLNRIHWKLSAKYEGLYVKNFETSSGKLATVVLDMNEEVIDKSNIENIEEDMIDFSVSLAKYLISSKVKSKFIVNSQEEKTIEIKEKKDFDQLMDHFLFQKSDGPISVMNFMDSIINTIPLRSWVGIITIDLNPKLVGYLINLQNSGYRVNLYYNDELEENELIYELEQYGIICINFKNIMKIDMK